MSKATKAKTVVMLTEKAKDTSVMNNMTDQLLKLLDEKSRQRLMMMKTGDDIFTVENECNILKEAAFKSFMQVEVAEMALTLEVDSDRIDQISSVLGINADRVLSKIQSMANLAHTGVN